MDDNLNSQYQAVAEIRKGVEVEKMKERQGLSKESATVQWNEKSETSLSQVPNLVVQCRFSSWHTLAACSTFSSFNISINLALVDRSVR